MQFAKPITLTAAALGLALTTAAPLTAQESDSQTDQAQKSQTQESETQKSETPDFTEAQLQAFAKTALDLAEINQEYRPKLSNAEGKDEQRAIMEEAQAEMKTTIQDADGISLQTYQQIGQAAQNDEELGARLRKMIQAQMQKQNSGGAMQSEEGSMESDSGSMGSDDGSMESDDGAMQSEDGEEDMN